MTGVGVILRALHDGEHRLEAQLLAVGRRHRAEHEVRHVATDLARWSREHTGRLADTRRHYGLDLAGPDGSPAAGSFAGLRETTAGALGSGFPPELALLYDLKGLYLAASENSLHWEMLAQAARATKDSRLLDLVSHCHPRTLRQIRWANAEIKSLAPQLITGMR